jgi:hypothetical protein
LAAGGHVVLLIGELDGTPVEAELLTGSGGVLKSLITGFDRDSPQAAKLNVASGATFGVTNNQQLYNCGGGGSALVSASRGPKVIPPSENFDTARYGFRPFPVVPVDYFERKHEEAHTGDRLSKVINSENVPGSTFNLYQEMSYGQLFPHGTVPAAATAQAGWDVQWNTPRYQVGGWQFSRHFDGRQYSAALGCKKPEASFFETIAMRVDFAPDELLLIDDAEQNVSGAKAAGWKAVLWTGQHPLRDVLAEFQFATNADIGAIDFDAPVDSPGGRA